MSGFRARNMRFCSVREIGLLNERIVWLFKVKHLLAIASAGFVVMVGSGSPLVLIAACIAAIATVSALYPQRAVSFEALLYGAVLYAFARREKITVDTAKAGESRVVHAAMKPEVCSQSWEEEEVAAGLVTREVAARKRSKVKKIT